VSSRTKDIISNHKRIIVIAVAIAAISMYMAPFDKLAGINSAEAQPGKKCPPPGLFHGEGLKYGIKKHVQCHVDNVKSIVNGIKDNLRGTAPGSQTTAATDSGNNNGNGGSSDNVKPADSGKTTANDVKTKVKDKVQGNGDDTHTARASSNVKPSDNSKPSDKPDKGKLSDSIKSRIRGT
jgi:hypothetical protein